MSMWLKLYWKSPQIQSVLLICFVSLSNTIYIQGLDMSLQLTARSKASQMGPLQRYQGLMGSTLPCLKCGLQAGVDCRVRGLSSEERLACHWGAQSLPAAATWLSA